MNTFPSEEIDVGVALDSVAVPPSIDKAKSLTSKFPLAVDEAYTSSLKVTLTEALSSLKAINEITGRILSPA